MIVIDPNSGVPVYRQLVEQVRFLIASGRLAGGDELPSTRTLSEQLGLNPMTVSKAYGLLEQDGVVQRRPGLPIIVAATTREAADGARLEQLRGLLGPAVTGTRQLGISTTRAVAEFRQLLADQTAEEEHDR
ncbi:MAG: GntR family transcriptional regulator [Gemmatimonadaceae bacterium]|nr:GntR family transcriptional regulator [Gemmatimonadaceae bacterium]